MSIEPPGRLVVSATKLGPAHPVEPFSLVFLDPPYGKGLAEKALVSAHEGAWPPVRETQAVA